MLHPISGRLQGAHPGAEERASLALVRLAQFGQRTPLEELRHILHQHHLGPQRLGPPHHTPGGRAGLILPGPAAACPAVVGAFRAGPQQIQFSGREKLVRIEGIERRAKVPLPGVVPAMRGHRHIPMIHRRQLQPAARRRHRLRHAGGGAARAAE